MAIMNSGIAMAAYVCPQLTASPSKMHMMEGAPCAGMDDEKPVQCAESKIDSKATVEQLSSSQALISSSLAVIVRVLLVSPPVVAEVRWTGTVPEPDADPPYLRTLRIRV